MSAQHNAQQNEAILRRLRQLLLAKRAKFAVYLDLLERQPAAIAADDVEAIEHYVALEREVLQEIQSVQRSIVPLRELGLVNGVDTDVDGLESALERMEDRLREQHAANRTLLSERTAALSNRIAGLSVPRRANVVFQSNYDRGALVDVSL